MRLHSNMTSQFITFIVYSISNVQLSVRLAYRRYVSFSRYCGSDCRERFGASQLFLSMDVEIDSNSNGRSRFLQLAFIVPVPL